MDFIQILIIAAVIAFSVYSNIQKGKAKQEAAKRPPSVPPSVPPPFSPAFPPPFVPQEQLDEAETEALLRAAEPPQWTVPPTPPGQSPRKPAVIKTPQPSASRQPDDKRPEAADRIQLDTPEEARRAFIYAEIFRRKYE